MEISSVHPILWKQGVNRVGEVMNDQLQLVVVRASEIDTLKEYIQALYEHDEDFDALVNIEEGVSSLMRNEALATAYFVKQEETRIGYVILTRYHSVEKGGLTIFIDELYVEGEHRRQGLGKKILNQILEIARGEGAKALWAKTESHNSPVQSFFSSCGFLENEHKNFEMPL